MDEAARHLLQRDPAFAGIIAAAPAFDLAARPDGDHFNALVRAIVYQQLAGKAAATIHGRFLELFAPAPPTPAQLLAVQEAALRAAGLSAAKARAIRDLALKLETGLVSLANVDTLDDEAVVDALTLVTGIGRWTAEMFLLFQLRRPDVWPINDLGVRRGYAQMHAMTSLPSPAELALLGEELRPFRSAAAWYCWRMSDTTLP